MAGKPLSGQVAIVTGASSGIGAAISEVLAKHGVRVVMAARRTEKLEELKNTIGQSGGQSAYLKTDVAVKQQVKDLVKFAESTYGPVDIFVNNAGVFSYSLMKNVHEEEWERIVDVNCKGLLHGIGAVLPGMVDRKKGHIIAISSDNGKRGYPGMAVYTGSKFFLEGVCRALRQEVCTQGVKVTVIQPGEVDTEAFGFSHTDPEAEELYGTLPWPGVTVIQATDIANAVIYAVSQPDHVAINELLIQPKDSPIAY